MASQQSQSKIATSEHDESGALEQPNSKMMKREPQGFEFHLANTPISYNFVEDEIEILTKQKNQMRQRIEVLSTEIQNSNPNINIIEQYKERHKDFLTKQEALKGVEKQFSSMKEEH